MNAKQHKEFDIEEALMIAVDLIKISRLSVIFTIRSLEKIIK